MRRLRSQNPRATFLIDGGDLVFSRDWSPATRLSRLPLARALAQGARWLEADVVGMGEQDLSPGPDRWAPPEGLPFVATDIVDEHAKPVFPPFRLVVRDGLRLAVLCLTGRAGDNPRWRALPPGQALQPALAQVRPQADLVVLVSHVPVRWLDANALRQVDLVVDAHGPGRVNSRRSPGSPAVISVTARGRGLALVTVPRKGGRLLTDQMLCQLLSVNPGLPEESLQKLADQALAEVNSQQAGPVASPQGYAGYQACRPCHEPQYRQWASTPHPHALQTLQGRHQDRFPECVRCHVTGATPFQKDRLPLAYLPGVQCEACHGPGLSHASDPKRVRSQRRPALGVCVKCHDSSVDQGRFQPELFLQKVRHSAH